MIIEQLQSNLIIASGENLISCHPKENSDKNVQIPLPVLPANLTKSQEDVLKKEERTINSLGVSKCGTYVAASTENKQIVVYNRDLEIVKNFIISRVASKVTFTNTNDLLVADKTGDVYLYKLDDPKNEPVLLLGHLSVVLDVTMSDCGRYIITCDRDEKIRVSNFPNTYNIQSYCLGHTNFVTSLKICGKVLVSASGDGTVRFWDYLKGAQLGLIDTEKEADAEAFQLFSQEMDEEKVDITALPICNLAVHQTSNNLFLAVSLYNYKVFLYKTNASFESTLLRNFQSCSFHLNEYFYMLDNNALSLFKLENDDYIPCGELTEFYNKYKVIFKLTNDSSVTVLYKRKFDNVQEYLERKKMRLEQNQ